VITARPPEDGTTYRDRVFRELRLAGTLQAAEFHDCVFDDVDLREARLLGCRFVDSDFLRCDLGLASVEGSAFGGVTIEASHAVAIDWTRARVDPQRPLEVDFKDSELSFATFAGLHLRRRRFEGCTIHDADFVGCDLTDASFRGSDLMGSRFLDCDLSGADLRKARAYAIDVRRNAVVGLRVRMPEASGLLHGLGVVVDEA
jgi:fluoroquinolone resistance protein